MKFKIKTNHLYLMLILIAIIIFACVGFNNKKSLEGFQNSSDAKNKFDKTCISSCEKEAKLNGIDNYKEKCRKSCDKITDQCNFHSTNSLDWWQCINNINPNVIIPQYILDQNQGNNIGDNTVNNNNNYSSMEDYLDDVSNSNNNNKHNKHHDNNQSEINKLKKENEKLQKLQDKYDKDIKKTQKALNHLDQYKGQGIPASQIPYGDEDLYILKSEIVPPVCPACPTLNCGDCKTQAPPCPPCARCPEPAFECKKVPNYKAAQTNPYLPRPWLNDFSQFGNHP